jgi:hypothetical protein
MHQAAPSRLLQAALPLCALVALAAFQSRELPRPTTRFWESRPASEWADDELRWFLASSPWVRQVGTQVYLATAEPVREAEAVWKVRQPPKDLPDDPLESDYQEFLRENPGKYIVLAALLPRHDALDDAAAVRRLEEKTLMKVGKRKHKLAGHFPPSISDPYLRLVFPRDIQPGDKIVEFELYLPSVPQSYKIVYFYLSQLQYKGRLEL